jgi:hypothetical protein
MGSLVSPKVKSKSSLLTAEAVALLGKVSADSLSVPEGPVWQAWSPAGDSATRRW